MDGFEVCRQLRTHRSSIEVPVIMTTALDDRTSRLQGLEAGADEFLAKPFDSVELKIRVGAVLRLNRFRRMAREQESMRSLYHPFGRRHGRKSERTSRVKSMTTSDSFSPR